MFHLEIPSDGFADLNSYFQAVLAQMRAAGFPEPVVEAQARRFERDRTAMEQAMLLTSAGVDGGPMH